MRVNHVTLVLLGLLALGTAGSSMGATPKRVLILHSFGRDFAPFRSVSEGLRTELARTLETPIDFHDVTVESARFVGATNDLPLVHYIQALFDGHNLDLVVPVGGPAVRFTLRHRDDLFPGIPMLATGVDERHLRGAVLSSNDCLVPIHIDVPEIVSQIQSLLPSTTNVVVILGSSPLESFWADTLQEELAIFRGKVGIEIWNDKTHAQLLDGVARLTHGNVVFFGQFSVDAAGVPYAAGTTLSSLHGKANVPIFSMFDYQMQHGIVGGGLISISRHSADAASAAARILRGETPAGVSFPVRRADEYVYNWEELQRWGIPESALPPGSTVVNRPRSIWQTHRWQVVTVTSVLLLQGVVLFALVGQMAHRRRAEKSLREFGGRLIQAQEAERGRLARELHDDLTQRLARLAIDAGIVERDAANTHVVASIRSVREELVRLSEDVHDLSYRLHPSLLNDLGLADALRAECERVARAGAQTIECQVGDIPDNLPVDIGLCLFRVAQEALRNVERHARATWIDVTLRGVNGGVQLAVRDNGTGFDKAGNGDRHSLGLASMRERLNLLDGELDIDSAPGRGTTIMAWVPVQGKAPLRHDPATINH